MGIIPKRSLESGKPAAEVARELESSIHQLDTWREEFDTRLGRNKLGRPAALAKY